MSIILQTVMVNGLCENKLGKHLQLIWVYCGGKKMCRMSMSYGDFCISDNNFIHVIHCNFNSLVSTWWHTRHMPDNK